MRINDVVGITYITDVIGIINVTLIPVVETLYLFMTHIKNVVNISDVGKNMTDVIGITDAQDAMFIPDMINMTDIVIITSIKTS